MKKLSLTIPLVFVFFFNCQQGEEVAKEPTLNQKFPIIDAHFHATSTAEEMEASYKKRFTDWFPHGISYPKTNEDLIQETLETLDHYNIVKVVAFGGTLKQWREKAPERIIPGASVFMSERTSKPEFIANLRSGFSEGQYDVLGEFWAQPAGLKPSDSSLEPYFDMAEEFDVPMGLHMGPAPRPFPAFWPKYQVALGNPLLLEDTLAKHPELRLYVMHAGYPFIDEMIGLMAAYPQVYVGISYIVWDLPRAAFHSYLRKLVEAGFEKRIMFASDYAYSPDIIRLAIEGFESASFLNEEQKRDIYYNNAVEFFRIEEETQ